MNYTYDDKLNRYVPSKVGIPVETFLQLLVNAANIAANDEAVEQSEPEFDGRGLA